MIKRPAPLSVRSPAFRRNVREFPIPPKGGTTNQLRSIFARTLTITLVLIALLASITFADEPAQKPWPYYTPTAIQPPDLADSRENTNEVDRFIVRKLAEQNLWPAEEASKQTLVRRLYFDLIGLPPSPSEIDAFLNDDSSDAYAKLVDRLLDDKRYGERWARLWLDLARYADTAGYEGDPDLPHAWRYRDYVIDAFNNDKPYDQFILEQIAGDEFSEIMGAGELPLTPPERTVAMTFLRLAPFTEPRGDETRHEMLSEMTSTVGSVFLGLTVGCAKCHDHKHDDIPTSDFYRMKAFFATVQIPPPERGDAYQIGGPLDADFYRPNEKAWAKRRRDEIETEAKNSDTLARELKQAIAKRIGLEPAQQSGIAIQSMTKAGNHYVFQHRSVTDGKLHWAVIQSNKDEWSLQTDGETSALGTLSGSNQGHWLGDIATPTHISIGQHTNGTGSPTGNQHQGAFTDVLVYDHPLSKEEREHIRRYVDAKLANDSSAHRLVPMSGLRFWLDAADVDANSETQNPKSDSQVASWTDKVNNIKLVQKDPNLQPKISAIAYGPTAIQFDSDFLIADGLSDLPMFNDEQGSVVIVFTSTNSGEGYGLEVGGGGEFISTAINPSVKQNDPIDDLIRDRDPRITKAERQQLEYLSNRKQFVKQHLKRLQPVAMSLRHSFGPPYEPGVPTSHVMVRGEYDNLGEVVEPGFLSAITGNQDAAAIRLDPFKRWPTRSRRMALAKWIASAKNPMTARVMVNRLWYWHFGQGIVQTPSDFGHLSGGPSHRKLLDWLARKFVESKWSIKAIHRLIVNSATYRQRSNIQNSKANNIDPDNRLLWKFNRQRLNAEAIRDAVLAVSGRLNPEQFGLPIFPPLPGDVAEKVKYSKSKWDTQYGPEGRKRSIYIYQQRTLTMPFMQSFDALVCDESRPRRRTSVTPLQALAMYNGEFVNAETIHFANRVRAEASDDPVDQVQHAFKLAFGRQPTDAERSRMMDLMHDTSNAKPLESICRVLYNANEFVYVD
ncbi:MAG: DUF1553 domain-containing protein [Planctomycetales bacterium]|nr:DUF1553 domain-containing protein [Planctomycetales bacterium]